MSLQSAWDIGQWPGEDPSDICGRYRDDPGYRWVVFAAVTLLLFGITNLIEGLAAVGNPRFFVSHPRPIVGDLTRWGFVTHQYVPGSRVARGWMGVVAGLAGVSVGLGVLCKNQLSRRIGVALVGLEAVGQLPRVGGDPLVSATIFRLCITALSALIGYSKRIRHLDITVLLSQGAVDADVVPCSMWREPSPPRGSESIDFDGLEGETEEARTWIAWRRSERNVTRTWNEWQAGDPRNATDLYHRYISTPADEARAAMDLERQVNRRGLERGRPGI
jgi:hypothetical protein